MDDARTERVGGPLVGRLERPSVAVLRASSPALEVAIVCTAALALGLIRLGSPSVWIDESYSARAVRSSYWKTIEGYHWLYYSIIKPWGLVGGTSEWALRLPSVIGAMLACALLVMLAYRLFDRWVALASGVLLAVSPLFVQWSQQARGYTLLVAVSLLATLLLLRALEQGSRGSWAAYGLAFSAVLVWHPVAGVLLALSHAVLATQRRERVLPHGLLAGVLIGMLGLPWAAQIAMRSTGEGVAMNWLKAPTFEGTLRTLADVSGAGGFGVALAVLGLWALRRAGKTDVAVWLGIWAFAPFVVALLVTIERPIFLDRYLLVAAPAFALLGGFAVRSLAARLRAPVLVAVVVATAIGLAHWYSSSADGNWHGEDWRSAVGAVLERRGEADAVVVAPWSASSAARYYGAEVSDISTADSIWVLRWSETGDDMTPAERRALGFGRHRLVERMQFGWRLSAQLWQRGP